RSRARRPSSRRAAKRHGKRKRNPLRPGEHRQIGVAERYGGGEELRLARRAVEPPPHDDDRGVATVEAQPAEGLQVPRVATRRRGARREEVYRLELGAAGVAPEPGDLDGEA